MKTVTMILTFLVYNAFSSELAVIQLSKAGNGRAGVVIENLSDHIISFEIYKDPQNGDRILEAVKDDVLRNGKWEEVVILKDGVFSGEKLTVSPHQKEAAFVLLGDLQGRVAFPASIRVRIFCAETNEPIISNPIIVEKVK